MRRRFTMALPAALIFVLGTSAATTAAAAHGSPTRGHYRGEDAHHHPVTFMLSSIGMVGEIRVNHELFPYGLVQERSWHACHEGKCIRGEWVSDSTVVGKWHSAGDSEVGF